MKLAKLRRKVDGIDAHILGLLSSRARITQEIGAMKTRRKASVYVPDREKSVYEHIIRKNAGPLSDDSLRAIYREIMSASLSLEKDVKIAYLGPESTFTHLAAIKKFGSSVGYTGCDTISDVFSEVEHERADYGVVPIENTTEGAVNYTLDMFIDSDLKICSEIYLEISHNLLSKERSLERIRRVYSNPQVFGQCRLWIETSLPKVELFEVSSTAKAAEIASRQKRSACIASVYAGRKHDLRLLSGGIEDSAHNTTRFLVIGKTEARATSRDKTSIMCSVKDKVGALHDILIPFKRHVINLTKIESRPSKVRAWEYYFFVDLEGHQSQKKIAKALQELRSESVHLKILGSYPVDRS